MKLKKCASDFELKRVLEVVRFGWLIIEMFTGVVENKKVGNTFNFSVFIPGINIMEFFLKIRFFSRFYPIKYN